jgi:hypothetical protein
MTLYLGNAFTEMARGVVTSGALQADGSTKVEPFIDAKHVASSIVHIASLPLDVTVLQMNIMYVNFSDARFSNSDTNSGLLKCHTLEEDSIMCGILAKTIYSRRLLYCA